MSQLSLFSAGMSDPSYDDLEGLLVGPASIERRGDAARLTVVVMDEWRAEVLLRGFSVLGAGGEVGDVPGLGLQVGTGFVPALYAAAQRWHSPTGKQAPPGLRLDGARLWWWCVAAGSAEPSGPAGYRLGLGAQDGDQVWTAAGSALAGAGVPGVLVGRRAALADGPAYRVVGVRRLVRLVELVGAPPAGAPDGCWPRVAQAHSGMAGGNPLDPSAS